MDGRTGIMDSEHNNDASDDHSGQMNDNNNINTNVSQSERLHTIADADADVDTVVSHLLANIGINFVAFDFDRTIIKIHTGGYWQNPLDELVPFVRPEIQLLLPKLLLHHRQKQQGEDNDETKNIHVAVVTFSSQPHVVRHILDSIILLEAQSSSSTTTNGQKQLVGSNAGTQATSTTTSSTTSGKIPIRGEDGSWKTPNPVHRGEQWWSEPSKNDNDDDDDVDGDEDDYEGKQPHMVSAIQELEVFRTRSSSGRRRGLSLSAAEDLEQGGGGGNGLEITKSSTLLIDDDPTNIRIAQQNGVHAVWLDPNNPSRLFDDLLKLRR
mmetsp:Transcript_62/g.69  ORF Transcript_62/g.69 Transcript_62/m.69 type:complete len:324 (-) Transcript_62:71-1042(-)